MTRFQRIKAWTKKNRDGIIAVSVVTAGVVSVAALVTLGVKADMAARQRALARLNADIDQLNAWHRFEHARILDDILAESA